jgi:hypothetical protein
MRRRATRSLLEDVAQHAFALRFPAGGPVEIGEIDRRRNEARVQRERRPELRFGGGGLLLRRVQQGQVHVRLRAVGVELLGGDVLPDGPVQRRALSLRQAVSRDARQHASGFDAHGTHRVV